MQGSTEAIVEFDRETLSRVTYISSRSANFNLELIGAGRRMLLRDEYRPVPFGQTLSDNQAIGNGRYRLHIQLASIPIRPVDVFVIILPVIMWLAAAVIALVPLMAERGYTSTQAFLGEASGRAGGEDAFVTKLTPEPAPPRDPGLFGTPPDDARSRLEFIDTLPASMSSSMHGDLERHNRLEVEWLSGDVVRRGRTARASPAGRGTPSELQARLGTCHRG